MLSNLRLSTSIAILALLALGAVNAAADLPKDLVIGHGSVSAGQPPLPPLQLTVVLLARSRAVIC